MKNLPTLHNKYIIWLIILILNITYVKAQFWTKKIAGNGQITTESRKVGFYDQITVTGAFHVKIITGNPGTLKVIADENLMPYIETYTKGHKLVMRVNPEFSITHHTKLYIELPADNLSKITLTGSGKVFNNSAFNWDNLKLILTGSGVMEITNQIKHINVSLTGSGKIYLSGNTEEADYNLTGSGNINAKDLKAQKIKASITGSGKIYLHAIRVLNARIMGSGNIIYYDQPKKINSKIFGSGDITYKR